MEQSIYSQHLKQAGLTAEQSRIYESLIKRGESLASDSARRAGISRTLGYKVLGELIELGLVEKREEKGSVATFKAEHPLKLKELIEKRQSAANDALSALGGILGVMTSEYNLAGGRPGVEFFEGMEGIAHVLSDTLTSKEVIYTYADLKAIDDVYRDLNKEYLDKRLRRHIEKKGILADTPFTRNMLASYDTSVTDSRLIAYSKEPSKTVIQMYDGKTSYIVMDRTEPVSMIIHNAFITAANRAVFEVLWGYAKPFSEVAGESNSNTA